MPKMRYFIKKL